MISRTSRYRDAGRFAPDPEGRPLFLGVRPRDVVTLPPVLEHALSAWDRPDLLAAHYYNDAERWWQILDANPELLFAAVLTVPDVDAVGMGVLVPRDTGK